MKTAESLIKNEIGKLLVDLAIVKVEHWAKHELNYVRHALDVPVVIPMDETHWVLGNYAIESLGSHRYKVTAEDNKLIHVFYSKRAAIFYAVFIKIKQYKLADAILRDDVRVAKLYDELEIYTEKLKRTRKVDNFKLQLWQTRALETKAQFKLARQELEKRINNAKYYKIWEKII